MVESISKIREQLAESNFARAQKEAELLIMQNGDSVTTELLELYFESLLAQSKPLPPDLHIKLIEKYLPAQVEDAARWVEQLDTKIRKTQRVLLSEMKIAEAKGRTEELYHLISEFQVMRFEARTPGIPEEVQNVIKRYFPNDFHIQLQRLALELMRMDLATCERSICDLILSCYERSSLKGTQEKLFALFEVLKSAERLHHLELYKNLCQFLASGISDKKEYKKIVELVIYLEDFRLQSLLLNLLMREGLEDVAQDYAEEVRKNKNYNYVYFDKYFPNLKKLFFQRTIKTEEKKEDSLPEIDLKIGKFQPSSVVDESIAEVSEEEVLLAHLLKHQSYSATELLDIAVSFVQSELYYAALTASQIVIENSSEDEQKLKAYYLKVTCLLKTGDYRAALDVSLEALTLAQTQNDVLSFMYSQAEAHLRLKEHKAAKTVLKKILSIDSSYRLTKERLERLNAI